MIGRPVRKKLLDIYLSSQSVAFRIGRYVTLRYRQTRGRPDLTVLREQLIIIADLEASNHSNPTMANQYPKKGLDKLIREELLHGYSPQHSYSPQHLPLHGSDLMTLIARPTTEVFPERKPAALKGL